MYYITREEYDKLFRVLGSRGKKEFLEELVGVLEKKGYVSPFNDIDFYVEYGYVERRYDGFVVGVLFTRYEFVVMG